MRMFLVGMCDIFLILYLTTLGQVDRSKVSDLTVADYMQLRALADEQKSQVDERNMLLSELREQIQEHQVRFKLADSELEELKVRLERERTARSRSERESEQHKAELDELERKRLALLRQKESASEELRRALTEKGALKSTVAELESSLEQKVQEQQKLDELMATLKEAQAEARVAEQEARLAAERAIAEKERAQREAEEAQKLARVSEQEKQQALEQAREASGVALDARIAALKATEQATFQKQVATRVTRELKAVTEPAKKAYADRVSTASRKVKVSAEVKNRLLGRSTEDISLRLLATRWGKEVLLFLPFEQAGLRDPDDAGRFTKYKVTVDGAVVRKFYVRPGSPSVIALILPGKKTGELKLKQDLKEENLTPTLFAVRNGTRMKFSDRIRDLDNDYYVFKRDRLSMKAGVLHLSVDGFRGTQEFGERIVTGDQIVDLRGELVGIATAENQVLLLDDLDNWVAVDISPGPAEQLLNSLWVARGRE